jgi:flagellar biosynthesis GTPase FlhF
VNTATTAAKVGFITKLLAMKGITSVVGIGAVIQGFSGATSTRKEISDYIKDSGELIVKLREAGMTDMADELAESNKDLRDSYDLIIPYIPIIGKNMEMNKVQGYRDKLNEDLNAYDAKVRSDKEKQAADKLAADQAAKIEQRAYDEKQLADKRAYEEKQLADKRAYDEQQAKDKAAADKEKADRERRQKQQDVAEQRTYTEQQDQIQAERQYDLSATATESAGSSTLNFGLLSSGGSIEFVDRDKASQVYFGKPYELLDPAQKRLLDLSKGG